jgi:hypothetical protein
MRPMMRGIAFRLVSLLLTLCAVSWGHFGSQPLEAATALFTQTGVEVGAHVNGQDLGHYATFGNSSEPDGDDFVEPSETDSEEEKDGDLLSSACPDELLLHERVTRTVLLQGTTIDLKDRCLLKALGARGPPTI